MRYFACNLNVAGGSEVSCQKGPLQSLKDPGARNNTCAFSGSASTETMTMALVELLGITFVGGFAGDPG